MTSPTISAPAAASIDTDRAIATYVDHLSAAIRRWLGAGDSTDADDLDPLARELFALQYEANPVYRAWCRARRVSPASLSSWKAIPGLPAVSFKEAEVTCLLPEWITTVFQSSGTTGQVPSRHFHGAISLAAYEASFLPWFRRSVLPAGAALAWISLVPGRADAPRSSLAYMIDGLLQTFAPADVVRAGVVGGGGEWTLDWDRLAAALLAAEAGGRPVLLMGTAFNVVHLLDALEAGGRRFNLPRGSMVMETGGYKGRSRVLTPLELSQAIRDRLGVDPHGIITEYGMSELSSQAYARWPGSSGPGVLRFPPWARALVISAETGNEVADGETGLLRLLDLANVGSVLCLQTEDLAIRRGSDFELLGRRPQAEPRGCSLMSA